VSEARDGIYGIDLGTTYSVVSYIDETGRPAVSRNSDGQDTTPSVVYFETADNIVVGQVAKTAAGNFPDEVVSLIKREMGDKDWRREFSGQEYTPASISALILSALARDAESDTGRPVSDAVITVPAYFGLLEKDATRSGGAVAGRPARLPGSTSSASSPSRSRPRCTTGSPVPRTAPRSWSTTSAAGRSTSA
jgi:molecular chaperone DnaK